MPIFFFFSTGGEGGLISFSFEGEGGTMISGDKVTLGFSLVESCS
jgi:hypothetical protein